jgi:alkylation response protein AidB-like acyl-CoA dehydrogenase
VTALETTPADALLAAARALVPEIRAQAEEIERGRRLPASLVQSLKQAGAFRMPMPRAWGGPEIDLVNQIRVIEELSYADASVGWCVMIGSDGGFFTAFLADAVGRDLYPDLDLVTGSSTRPSGKAAVADGGYRLSGRWPFSSGCLHSEWIVANAVVHEGEEPRLGDNDVPEMRFCYLAADQVQIQDTWYTTGLRGSGSNDFVVEDAFVPAERTFGVRTSPVEREGPLYAWPWMFVGNAVGVPLGIGRAAVEVLVTLAETKATIRGGGLRDEPYVQVAVARADGLVRGARGYVYDVMGEFWDTLVRGDEPSMQQRARFRLALAVASQMCVEAVDLMYQAGGGTSLYAASPLDRIFRDAHTVHQHVTMQPKVFETAGRMLLGLDPIHPGY